MRQPTVILLLILSGFSFAQQSIISSGSSWKYFDNGDINNPSWKDSGFNDASWSTGNAELGYGDGDENTVVSYGSNSSNKYPTTYFRKSISVSNPSQFASLNLQLKRDDGAVVYINGTEVWRSNMPGGTISYGTFASGTVAWPNENDWQQLTISAGYLQSGNNTIAVEVHQENAGSSDISFDFSMTAYSQLNAQIIRGPYLQKATQNSIIIRWRTDVPTDSRVDYGISPVSMTTFIDPNFTTDHSVELTGLAAGTQYFYQIGMNNSILDQSANMYFETLPMQGTEAPYSFVVLGDCGTGYQEQLEVKDAFIQTYGNHHDGVILLGDNAYQSGFDSEYQSNFFGKYDEIFDNTVIWPAPGNHDYNNNIPFSPAPAYYEIFDCPAFGESGGLASGTEKYYSFDIGNVHFISLDSYDEPRSASAAMAVWLQNDLSSNTLPWVIAYWHHPPYTKGSHDSDNDNFLDGELVDMREQILPIIESYDVDLVLNGHSHSYERSMLIGGHYGSSDSFDSQHIFDSGSGDFPTDCPYQKPTMSTSHNGTVYCVMGNSGKTSGIDSEWPHPVMYSYTNQEVGAILVEVDGNKLDMTFLTSGNTEYDHFSIVKRTNEPQEIEACINTLVSIEPTWNSGQDFVWSPGNITGPTYQITSLTNATVVATDQLGCISDTFNLIVLENDTCGYLDLQTIEALSFSVSYGEGIIRIVQGTPLTYDSFELYDILGRKISELAVYNSVHEEQISSQPNGIYFLKPKSAVFSRKFIKYE